MAEDRQKVLLRTALTHRSVQLKPARFGRPRITILKADKHWIGQDEEGVLRFNGLTPRAVEIKALEGGYSMGKVIYPPREHDARFL